MTIRRRILLVLTGTLLTNVAMAHSWYPPECCAERDCVAVDCETILDKGDHLEWKGIQFHKSLERPSQDRDCHVCYNQETKLPHCIFTMSGV